MIFPPNFDLCEIHSFCAFCSRVNFPELYTHALSSAHPFVVSSLDGFYSDGLVKMTSFVTLLAALAAITSPLIQAAPVAQAVADPQQAQQRDCAAALVLAQGIKENIEDQKNEKAALAQVDQVLQQTPVDANAFATAKANLLTFVNNGIAIREANQLITPLGNKATEGLAIVSSTRSCCRSSEGNERH